MRAQLLHLLKTLEEVIPPPLNCHHCLTFARYGSDTTGWEDKLALQINNGDVFHCFFLEEDDFGADPMVLVREIASHPLAGGQLGVGPGQYTE